MPQLDAQSRARTAGLHPKMIQCVELAATLCPIAVKVLEGVRSDEQCYINYGKGRTVTQLAANGVPARYAQPRLEKVTWVSNPLSSKHRKQKDGFSHAVDLLGAPYGWTDLKPFDLVAKAMFEAAKQLGIEIRWGADWDADGNPRERGETDSPHFELAA